ncbi:MAG: sigma-70 family RNA polymerase sigma factor [Planctomycetes bacterium]|nr:sigma-70 family RNA polymerase sigma factor [Planctomycetota bacterium]
MNDPHDDPTAEAMLSQGRALRGLARSILRDTDGADDVVQEAFARALTARSGVQNREGWLVRVVQNLARRRLRDRSRHRDQLAGLAGRDATTATRDPADVLGELEMQRRLTDTVAALAEPHRRAIVLRYFHDLPPRRIARQLGIPVATVKTHLQRGLAELRQRLDAGNGDRRAWLTALVPLAHPRTFFGLGSGSATTAAAAVAALAIMNTKPILLAAVAVACLSLTTWAAWPGEPPAATPVTGTPAAAAEPTVSGDLARMSPTAAAAPTSTPTVDRLAAAEDEHCCTVVGRIVAASTGAPVANARLRLVNFWADSRCPDLATAADPDGRFELRARFSGTWIGYRFALADAPNWGTLEVRLEAAIQNRIADDRLDLGTLALVPGVPVAGRVLDRDGTPLTVPARLLLWDPSKQGSYPQLYDGRTLGFSGERGVIRLGERLTPPPGAAVMIAAICERGIGWTRLGIGAGQTHLPPIEIRLRDGGGVTVRVEDDGGTPIRDARVSVVPYFLPVGLAPMWQPRRGWNATPSLAEIAALFRRTTAGDGTAEFANLPLRAGKDVLDANREQPRRDAVIIGAHADGFVTNGITANPDPNGATEVTIVLQRKRRAVFAGRVATADGAAVADVHVRLNGNPEVASTTDVDGRYELPAHTFASNTAYFLLDGGGVPMHHETTEIPPTGDRIEHDFVVERRAPVTGRVVDQHGTPVAGAAILLGVEGGVHYSGVPGETAADGVFAFPDALPSQDHLWIHLPEPRTAWETIAPRKLSRRNGETITLHRVAVDLVDLHVAVIAADSGAPITPNSARLQPLRGESWNTDVPQPRPELALGEVTARGIPPGRYRLVLEAAGELRAEHVLEVPAGASVHEARCEVYASATVVCTLDKSGMTPGDLAEQESFLVLLDHRENGDSYIVDERGEPLNYTPNTGAFRIGKRERFALRRVTANVPLRLYVPDENLFGEVWFTAEPGVETHVTLRPERAARLEFEIPAAVLPGAVGVDVRDTDGSWHPAVAESYGQAIAQTLALGRGAGPVAWRLRLWPADGGEVIERSGSVTARAGETSTVAW